MMGGSTEDSIGQIGHCIGGNFNIHIWAWSVIPSVQEGRLCKSRTQSAWTAVTYLPLEISYMTFVQSSELDKVVFNLVSNGKHVS